MKRAFDSHHHSASHRKANGHAGANGSGLSSTSAATPPHTELGKAGPDDASEFSAAVAASAFSTAGTDRQACADLAESAAEGRPRAAGTASGSARAASSNASTDSDHEASTKGKKKNRFADVPPGRKPLPVNGEAFVKAVHRRVDLIELEVMLLTDGDEKIVQRELAYLRELRYGKRGPITDDEPRRVLYDAPRPEREVQ